MHTDKPAFSNFAIPKITGSCTVLKDFFYQGTRMVLQSGSLLSLTKEMQDAIFYVEQGEVQIIFDSIEGQQRAVVSFGEGGIFNIAPATLHQNASGEYQCLQLTVLYYIPAKKILNEDTMQEYPEVALALVKHLSRLVLIYHTFLTDLQVSSFFVRFCRYLLSLYLHHNTPTFPLGTTQDRLAATLGVHRATLSRAIQRLRQEGVLGKLNSRTVEILNPERLRSLTE